MSFMSKIMKIDRFLEILPGALTWLVLTSPIWLSFRLPFAAAALILFLDTYWVYRALRMAFFSFVGYRRMQKAINTDWLKKLEELTGRKNLQDSKNPANQHSKTLAVDSWQFYHWVVIPTYKEPVEILEQNLSALVEQNYPKEKLIVLLALEEREDQENIEAKKEILQRKFSNSFFKLFITIHPKDYPGHHPGPGSNRTYAVQQILPQFKSLNIGYDQVILTTLDADFVTHPNFLAGLTHKYLTTPNPHKKTFTGVFWYYNNYWQAPFFTRIVATGVSFWQLSEMTGSDKYMNFSSHSINLQSLIDMNFWVVDKVNDDGEFYWRAYYHFAGDYHVVPHFLPIWADTVQHKDLIHTFQEQYLQLRRWAYGVEHIPMIVRSYFKRTDIPFLSRTDRVWFLVQSYLTWSTLAVLITFGGFLLQLVNPRFAQTTLAFNLPHFSSALLTVAIVGLFTLILIHERLVPPRPTHWNLLVRAFSYVQWIFIPLILLVYGSLPAIDAQTRLMLGKYMEFRVTAKVRK